MEKPAHLGQKFFGTDANAIWRPGDAERDRSRLAALMARNNCRSLDDLHRRAVDDKEWYWGEVVDDLGIRFDSPWRQVCDFSAGPEYPKWFVGGQLNLAATCVDQWVENGAGDRPAIIWENEAGDTEVLSYGALLEQSAKLAQYLRSKSVQVGDAVGLFLPMIPETAVAMFACARVGAVAVPAFSGYGPDAIAARFAAADARVVITADGFCRKGKSISMKQVFDEALQALPAVQSVVVVSHLDAERVDSTEHDVAWEDALNIGAASGETDAYERVDPNTPVWLAYTSGTTGTPKAIVLSQGGFLAKVMSDFAYLFDIQQEDVVLWPTDLGWILAPMLIFGALGLGATVVFFEGLLGHEAPDRAWRVVERHGVTVMGTSPTATRALMRAGDSWAERHEMPTLRTFASTGEPWDAASWEWLFRVPGRGKLPILNYSGGTEVGGGILGCYTIAPLKPGGFSGPVIGIDTDVVDGDGNAVRGAPGELILRSLAPGTTHSFLNDDERYFATYWTTIPGVWVHGDSAEIDSDGFWYLRGRSDDTIKVAGKRIGPAEVEGAIGVHDAVRGSAVIGIPDDAKGSALVAFVVADVDDASEKQLARELNDVVVERLGRTMALDDVVFVESLPITKTGKMLRRLIRAQYLGSPVGDVSSLDDPRALDAIPRRAEAARTAVD